MEGQNIKNIIYEELQIPQEIKLGQMSVSLYDLEKIVDKISSRLEALVGLTERNFFGQWHFTKDELPELDKSVLCYVKVNDIDGDTYETLTFGKRFINYTQEPVFVADAGSFSKGEEIICWMYVKEIPLPKF